MLNAGMHRTVGFNDLTWTASKLPLLGVNEGSTIAPFAKVREGQVIQRQWSGKKTQHQETDVMLACCNVTHATCEVAPTILIRIEPLS